MKLNRFHGNCFGFIKIFLCISRLPRHRTTRSNSNAFQFTSIRQKTRNRAYLALNIKIKMSGNGLSVINETDNGSDDARLSDDLEKWMTNLPAKLRATPIIHLAIPGSHDSLTSNITTSAPVAPDAEDFLKKMEWLGPLIKYFTVRWSKTQQFSITEQLQHGIRYFDLRIATKSNSEELFIVHGLYADDVQSVFDKISKFLEAHPQEIVIIDCQHFYAFTQSDHEKLMLMFNKTFGTKLLPYLDHINYITLEYMTTQYRYQVIAVYRSDAARFGQPLLWPSASFPTPWPNTMSKNKLFYSLDVGLKHRPANGAYISQCVLTPTCAYVFANLFSTVKQKCAIDLEDARLRWLSKQCPGAGGLNIVIADFVELSDCQYIKTVINLNSKLLNNQQLPQ